MIVLTMAAALAAQDPYERPAACMEDPRSAACEAAERARLGTLFDVPAIEAEAAAGATVYRAFIYDGYGRALVAVAAEARPDEPPKVVLSGAGGRRLTGPLTRAAWERVVADGLLADREVAPLPPADPPGLEAVEYVCLHGWVAAVEMANTETTRGPLALRRKTESACGGDSLTLRHAFLLAEVAVQALPGCAALDPRQHRNDPARLDACLDLRGNTLAAAELMNEKGDPPRGTRNEPVDSRAWGEWLGSGGRGRLDWGGEVFEASSVTRAGEPRRPRLDEVIADRFAALPAVRIYQAEFGARDFDSGWIKGEIVYDGDGDRRMAAEYRQEWTAEYGYWSLVSWTVGPFHPVGDED